MKNFFYYLSISALCLTGCSTPTETKKPSAIKKDSVVKAMVLKDQILLTNNAEFKDHTGLYGASAFLIEYKNKTYAITAKHLLGPDGGVEPEIKPHKIVDYLLTWKMFPRVSIHTQTDTVIIGNENINNDSLQKDILMLPIKNTNFNILSLKPSFDLPKEGDILYIIGCPYSEKGCKQNIYETVFNSYDPEEAKIIVVLKNKLELAGFSGAPLVDSKGRVIGVITSGGEDNGLYFIVATFIKEIEKIKL